MKLGKRTIRLILYPLLLVGGCHMLLTGSPVPTWHLEKLHSPVSVHAITPDGLLLSDGRTLKLPLVKRLPADEPLLEAAVKHGVEITDEGNVFGLLWLDRTCGNDPCIWYRRRVNLATLAIFLAPETLDESETPADLIADIKEYLHHFTSDSRPRRYTDGRITLYDLQPMYHIECDLEDAGKQAPNQQPVDKQERRWTFPASDFSPGACNRATGRF